MATTTQSSGAAARAAKSAHETVDQVAAKAAAAQDSIRERASAVGAQARETRDQVQRQGAAAVGKVERFVHEHPMAALGIAFSAGIIAAAMLRR